MKNALEKWEDALDYLGTDNPFIDKGALDLATDFFNYSKRNKLTETFRIL